MFQMGNWFGIIMIVSASFSTFARAGGGDHDVPTPFESVDQRFELADGEYYTLVGKVVFLPSQSDPGEAQKPYLLLNLEDYPWLATSKRENFPFFLLEGDSSVWKKYAKKRVKIYCQAHGRIVQGKNGLEYSISLELVKGGIPL